MIVFMLYAILANFSSTQLDLDYCLSGAPNSNAMLTLTKQLCLIITHLAIYRLR